MSEFVKYEKIINSEYSEDFDNKRKHAMVCSFYKYGPVKQNYMNGNVDAIQELEKRLSMFKACGNTDLLIDIANFSMIRFMYPQGTEKYIESDSNKSPGLVSGVGVMEL